MPHIKMNTQLPGILSLFSFRPETAKPLNELAQILLRGPSSLSAGERELIAAYVSNKNNCVFCTNSHAGAATALLSDKDTVAKTLSSFESANISDKMKALLKIAGAVQENGCAVKDSHIQAAVTAGATDVEIHDTVLIAAAFCMYNRYVDGLATVYPPAGHSAYAEMGQMLAQKGYTQSF